MAYGEVQGKTWRSPSIRGLSDSEKLAWSYLLSNQHSNMLGYYLLPLPYMADDLEWPLERASESIEALERRGLIAYDHAAQVVFVCKYLKYNRLSSGAREKGALARLEELPESSLLLRLSAAVNEWHPQLVDLRTCLKKWNPSEPLLGVLGESGRTPGRVIVIDTDIEEGIEEESYAETDSIINYLNQQTDSDFKHSKSSRENIHARLVDGLTVADCKLIVDYKCREWLGDTEWEGNLTPVTLFRPTKYENNLNAAKRWEAKGRPSKNSDRAQTSGGADDDAYMKAHRERQARGT